MLSKDHDNMYDLMLLKGGQCKLCACFQWYIYTVYNGINVYNGVKYVFSIILLVYDRDHDQFFSLI